MYKIGLDVHKKTITGLGIDSKGNLLQKATFENSTAKVDKFLERFLPEMTEIGMEASTYIYPLYDHLIDKGFKVRVAHAKKLRRITQNLSKNDENDAEALARQLLVQDFPEAFILNREQRDDRELIRMRVLLTQEQTRYKNRIRMLLGRFQIKLKSKSPYTKEGIKELSYVDFPSNAKQKLTILIRQLQRVATEIKDINRDLDKLEEKFEKDMNLLKGIPGIGQFTALAFLTELADYKRFNDAKGLSAYVGYIPKMSHSGSRTRYGRMRFDGNSTLRYAFNRAAECATMRKNIFRDFYQRLYPRKGRRTAISAVAHKMMRVCYGVLKKQEPFTDSGSLRRGG